MSREEKNDNQLPDMQDISPEMIRAGIDVWGDYDYENDDPERFLSRVYCAMFLVRPPLGAEGES